MNFTKTMYLSIIKEKSYIQIKKAQIGCIIGLCESTLTASTKQELNQQKEMPDHQTKKLLPKEHKAKFDNFETPIFPNGVS